MLYYKYTPPVEDEKDEDKKEAELQAELNKPQVKRHHPILETDDKSKIKIRFSDLPLSRCTGNGLFKSKFIKMTEV